MCVSFMCVQMASSGSNCRTQVAFLNAQQDKLWAPEVGAERHSEMPLFVGTVYPILPMHC